MIIIKAVQVTGYGDLDKLEIVNIPTLKPKENEVLIQVKACAINNTEIWMREGAYGNDSKSGWRKEGVQFPRTPGSDIAGVVVQVGDQVSSSMIGKSVVVFPFTSSGEEGVENISEDMSFIGSEYDGGYAEYVVWPADLCFDMPLVDFKESAVFSVSGLTAWHMAEQVKIKPNETVMVTGANGGVGSFNVQIAANVFKAKVIAIVGDLSLKEQLIALGATHVLSYKSKNLEEEILDINNGPVDSVLDVVGDALFETSLKVLKNGGKFCTSGSAGGQKSELDFKLLYLKHLRLYGSVLGTKQDYQNMLKAISNKQIKAVIDCTFPLEQARQAQSYFKKSGKLGKVVLIP